MISFLENKTLKLLDEKIDVYLVYLVHIQQSINLSINDKLNAFNESDRLGNEIHAITEKVITSKINDYNEKDFEMFITNTMNPLIAKINSEIAKYDRKLSFNNKAVYSIREVIQKLEETKGSPVYLTKDKIDRLLSFKRLYKTKKDEEFEKELSKEMDKLKKKLDDDFEGVRYKTFKEFIKGVNHKNEDYLYKTNKYLIDNYLMKNFVFQGVKTGLEKGYYFVQSKINDIELIVDEGNIRIEYNLSFNRVGETTNVKIIGFIKHSESRVDFFIDETYSNSLMDSVLNAFNLVPLIKKYNDSYVAYFHEKVKEEDVEEKAKQEIDNFFMGKII